MLFQLFLKRLDQQVHNRVDPYQTHPFDFFLDVYAYFTFKQ